MATDDDDRKKLLDAVRGVSCAPPANGGLPSLPITSKFQLESSWNGGRYLDLGYWRGKGVTIDVSLDKFIGAKQMTCVLRRLLAGNVGADREYHSRPAVGAQAVGIVASGQRREETHRFRRRDDLRAETAHA
jgi:hypothetical protein